jgi:hypothetical protein
MAGGSLALARRDIPVQAGMTTNLMPAALDPSSNDELTALPPGLTEADAARVTAAISAAPRRVHPHAVYPRLVPSPPKPCAGSVSGCAAPAAAPPAAWPDRSPSIRSVAHGQHARTDPVAALIAWRAVRGEAPGPLFTRIWATSVSLTPLSEVERPGQRPRGTPWGTACP